MRAFRGRKRSALYLMSGGKCEICGKALEQGWHADHIHPHSKGGQTNIGNGQALCPECNLKKGDKVFEYRQFQQDLIDVVMRKAKALQDKPREEQDKVVFADVHPGSGKTIAVLAAANRLFQQGYIDAIVVLVPRLNLAEQFEQDWHEIAPIIPEIVAMQRVLHRDNNPPLLLMNASGYVTTYQSLLANTGLHISELRGLRYLLACDEMHQLGVDWRQNAGMETATAGATRMIADNALLIVLMTGTKYRADGKRLLLAEYSAPDKDGRRHLEPDVQATYRTGVTQYYLRRFEYHLHNGPIDIDSMGVKHYVDIKTYKDVISLKEILQTNLFWEPLIDRFMAHFLRERETISNQFCGLVAADDQAHAKKVKRYIESKYPELKVLIAVSDDGKEAKDNLAKFRAGKADILITVLMAYVGFDYKPINHVCILISFRTEVFLRQLVARGLRMMKGIPEEHQTCHVFVPADEDMEKFVKVMRDESDKGVEDRIPPEGPPPPPPPPKARQFATIENVEITDVYALGIDPNGDTNSDEYRRAMAAKAESGAKAPVTELMAWSRALANVVLPPVPSREAKKAVYKTQKQRVKDAKSDLRSAIGSFFARVYQIKPEGEHYIEAYQVLERKFGQAPGKMKEEAPILECIKTVQRWTEQGYYD